MATKTTASARARATYKGMLLQFLHDIQGLDCEGDVGLNFWRDTLASAGEVVRQVGKLGDVEAPAVKRAVADDADLLRTQAAAASKAADLARKASRTVRRDYNAQNSEGWDRFQELERQLRDLTPGPTPSEVDDETPF